MQKIFLLNTTSPEPNWMGICFFIYFEGSKLLLHFSYNKNWYILIPFFLFFQMPCWRVNIKSDLDLFFLTLYYKKIRFFLLSWSNLMVKLWLFFQLISTFRNWFIFIDFWSFKLILIWSLKHNSSLLLFASKTFFLSHDYAFS